jgi:hypothetical protein
MNTLNFILLPLLLLFGAIWAILITLFLTISFCLLWFFGGKITVKESGEVTGYFRWFKFYPKFDK